MNTIKYTTVKYVQFLALFFFISCNNFLEEEGIDFISSGQFYETEEDFELALNGVYAILNDNIYYKQDF